nr:gliding motility-associated C-terminal domain-containing protein [uncultured Flavobacterium sp.]
MLNKGIITTIFILLLNYCTIYAQQVQLYEQINGRYDFTFVGNTLNKTENGLGVPCEILTSSSANLLLFPNEVVYKAYLYWAGSGQGDFDIKLNGIDIQPQRTFTNNTQSNTSNFHYFSAFADVTELVQNNTTTTYTVSEFDLTNQIFDYCSNSTNFGGWAILVVYESENLPLNQLNIYDGLQSVPQEIEIDLGILNVIDNTDSSIGFIAWEGDKDIAVNESLTFNGNVISRLPLNPEDNAFNGTNTVNGSRNLYNMDLDIYFISQYLSIGAQPAVVKLTSDQDFVLINVIITKLNSQLPDATATILNVDTICDSRDVTLNYSINNYNSTSLLPGITTYHIYVNDEVIFTDQIGQNIAIGEQINYSRVLTIPDHIPNSFTFKIVVDEAGVIPEIIETNNETEAVTAELKFSISYTDLPVVTLCNEGHRTANFAIQEYLNDLFDEVQIPITAHYTLQDAQQNTMSINQNNIVLTGLENTLYIRFDNFGDCSSILPLTIKIRNCKPTVYNAISVTNDNLNDQLTIEGLENIFENYTLEIYNRWGKKIWSGDNSKPLWNGDTENGKAPTGTYFYILNLNDIDFTTPLQGYIYLTH